MKIQQLGSLGEKRAAPRLLELLNVPNFITIYLEAIKALGKIGDKSAVQDLLELLEDQKTYLSERIQESEESIKSCEETIESYDEVINSFEDKIAQKALSELIENRTEAIEIRSQFKLLQDESLRLLGDSDYWRKQAYLREEAIKSLGEIGDPIVLPKLIVVWDSMNLNQEYGYGERLTLIEALGKFNTGSIIPTLFEALEDSSEEVRHKATEILNKISVKEAFPELLKALEHSNSRVKEQASRLLENRCTAAEIPELLEALKHQNPEICANTASLLGKIGAKEALPQLLEILKHPDLFVRATAVKIQVQRT